jgi:ubiquinone biosynthesis protein COQ9
MTVPYETAKAALLDAALLHVPFDGWSEATFQAAVRETGLSAGVAHAVCPRGAVDLAVAYHKAGDAAMLRLLRGAGASTQSAALKFSRQPLIGSQQAPSPHGSGEHLLPSPW